MKGALLALSMLLLPGAGPNGIVLEQTPAQGGIVRGAVPLGTSALSLDGTPVPVAPDGRFLVGFGRDAPPSAILAATTESGDRIVRPLSVARVEWRTRRLPNLPRNAARTPEAIAVRADEVARINVARAGLKPVDGWRQRFRWPVVGRISGVFGSQTIYAGEPGGYHGGIDIARPAGTAVHAPADGVVVLASPPMFSIEGNLLIVDHGLGLSSAFLHLSRIEVPVGARVKQGERLGAIGTTGRSTGPHLHWGLIWRGVRVDPRSLLDATPAGS